MIPTLIKTPISVAQHVTVGAVRLGLGGATAVLRLVLPGVGVDSAREQAQTRVSTEPVTHPPAPVVREDPTPGATTTAAGAKKTAAKKTAAKQVPAKKTAPKKTAAKKAPARPAEILDEPAAPVDDDPVVYSSGPEVATAVPAEDLEALRAELRDEQS